MNETKEIETKIEKTTGKRKVNIIELKGVIDGKKKVENATGKYVDNYYYTLTTRIDGPTDKIWIKKLLAFKEKIDAWGNPDIWRQIENSEYTDKRYLFFCTRYKMAYRVLDWKQIDNLE